MHKCPECGFKMEMPEEENYMDKMPDSFEGDDESRLKTDILSELEEALSGALDSKLKSKKPSLMSVEVASLKPKKEDEEEEEF